MSQDDHYYTIEENSFGEFKDRGSKFIACAYPVESLLSFKEKRAQLKKAHPKAVHHCFAYRMGTDGNVYRVSDDGEPAGSAGKPILGQIDSRKLTNVMVFVVRYFGGTLLGVPGLIQAYKMSTAQALEAARIIQRPRLIHYRLQFDYTRLNDVMKLVKQLDCVVFTQQMQLFCSMEIGIPAAVAETCLARLRELPAVETEKS